MASNAPANIHTTFLEALFKVSANSQTGGYDCKFVQEPSSDLKCLICLCVAKDPLQHGDGGCGKIFCKSCITEYKKKNNKCPNCRRDITTFKDVRSERDIQSLKVKCDNIDNGCEWVDELRSLENHLQSCDYALVTCPNKRSWFSFFRRSSREGGTQCNKILRKDLQKHLTDSCPHRQHTCPHCQKRGEYQDITGAHYYACPKVKKPCSNTPQCQDLIPREDLQTHLSTDCLYQKMSCKYKAFGCEETPLRKDLQDHEKDDKLHLHITMEMVLTLKKRTDMIVPYLSTVNGAPQLTFKVTEFAVKKKEGKVVYSPPFYTHPQGYKMTIDVHANGYGPGKGTHISVYAYLMKGENDDELSYPFQGTITFELLNQLEDRNHHKESYTYEGSEKGSRRVTDRDRAGSASGVPKFIPHNDLNHNAAKKRCYLKNDCLVFRIYVEVPSYKPWLQCSV